MGSYVLLMLASLGIQSGVNISQVNCLGKEARPSEINLIFFGRLACVADIKNKWCTILFIG